MQSRVSVLGQQVNPFLTMLALGVLGSAVLTDMGALMSGVEFFGLLAYWDLSVGVLVGVVALCVLLVDVVTAPFGTLARQVSGFASATIGTMVFLFGLVWFIRGDGRPAGNVALLLVELVALAVGIVGACVRPDSYRWRLLHNLGQSAAVGAAIRVLASSGMRLAHASSSAILRWSPSRPS